MFFFPLAAAIFPAIAFLVVVHRAILAALLAARFVRRKCRRAYDRRQNRKQDLRVLFHGINLVRNNAGQRAKIRPIYSIASLTLL
jgi:hypothetical protein